MIDTLNPYNTLWNYTTNNTPIKHSDSIAFKQEVSNTVKNAKFHQNDTDFTRETQYTNIYPHMPTDKPYLNPDNSTMILRELIEEVNKLGNMVNFKKTNPYI